MTKNCIKYIIPIWFLLLGACSADEKQDGAPLLQQGEPVQFRTLVGGGESDVMYESEYFKEGDQIRIYCPVSYSAPSFEDDAMGMFIYSYTMGKTTTGDWSDWPYKFSPLENTKGFDWRILQPTSIYYVFEALHFPGKSYLKEVPVDQTTADKMKVADMLIAHHRQTLEQKGKPVKLTFHHAFAMVEVRVKLPVSDTPTEGPYPAGALQRVYMKDMLTRYNVNYSEVINNDELRTVRVPAEDEEATGSEAAALRKDIDMWRVSDDTFETKVVDGDTIRYQQYIYRGIVPEQKFREKGQDFLYFAVKRHDGTDKLTYYRFKVTGTSFSLKSSHILSLTLTIDDNSNEVVVLTAKIKPWNQAEADMEIFPKKQ